MADSTSSSTAPAQAFEKTELQLVEQSDVQEKKSRKEFVGGQHMLALVDGFVLASHFWVRICVVGSVAAKCTVFFKRQSDPYNS